MDDSNGADPQPGSVPRMPFRWEDPHLYAAQLAAHYQAVRRRGAIDIVATARALVERTGLRPEDPLFRAAEMVAQVAYNRPFEQARLLTDVTRSQALMLQRHSAPEYHNPFHAFEVACNVAILLDVGADLSPRYGALTLVAALGHDLCHDGGSNRRPFHLESRAVHVVRSVAREAGASEQDQIDLEALIFATDVASARPTLSALIDGAAPPAEFPLELTRIVQDSELARAAAVIVDGDVLCSAGLTWEMHRFQSEALGREWNREMGARDAVFFLDTLLGRRFLSRGGQYFMPNLLRNFERANSELTAVV